MRPGKLLYLGVLLSQLFNCTTYGDKIERYLTQDGRPYAKIPYDATTTAVDGEKIPFFTVDVMNKLQEFNKSIGNNPDSSLYFFVPDNGDGKVLGQPVKYRYNSEKKAMEEITEFEKELNQDIV